MEIERAGGAERDVYFKDGARIDFANHSGATLLGRSQPTLEDIARAETDGTFQRKKNISRADGDTDRVAQFGVAEWDFD